MPLILRGIDHRVFDKYQFLHPSSGSRRLSAAKMNIIYGAIFEVEVVDVSAAAAGGEATTLLSNLTTYVVVCTWLRPQSGLKFEKSSIWGSRIVCTASAS